MNAFLVNGSLPRDQQGVLSIEETLIAKLRAEAKFFRLPALQAECDALVSSMPSYLNVRRLIQTMSAGKQLENALDVEYKCSESPLTKAIRAAIAPACTIGNRYVSNLKLLNADKWTLKELYDFATLENPLLKIDDSFEIDASKLDAKSCEKLMQYCRRFPPRSGFFDAEFEFKLVKLCVDTVSAPERTYVGTAKLELRGVENASIGTLIVILDKEYEGGEVCICSDDKREEKIPRHRNSVAINADCAYRMNRMTSGTRVSLIYDMVSTAHRRPRAHACDEYVYGRLDATLEYDRIWYDHDDDCETQVLFRTTIPPEVGQKVLCEVSEELKTDDFLFMALQYVYPENAKSLTDLRGGDRALYDLLCAAYDVHVVAVVVQHQGSGLAAKFDRLHAALFTPDLVSRQLTTDNENGNRRKRHMTIAKLFLPHTLEEEHVMHYRQSTEENQQEHDSVYLVSALQVSKREKMSK